MPLTVSFTLKPTAVGSWHASVHKGTASLLHLPPSDSPRGASSQEQMLWRDAEAGAAGRLSRVYLVPCTPLLCLITQAPEISAAGLPGTYLRGEGPRSLGFLQCPCYRCLGLRTLFRTSVIVRHREGQEIHLPNYNLTGFLRTFRTSAM